MDSLDDFAISTSHKMYTMWVGLHAFTDSLGKCMEIATDLEFSPMHCVRVEKKNLLSTILFLFNVQFSQIHKKIRMLNAVLP